MQNDQALKVATFLNSFPDSLTPIYSTESPNVSVKLYDGPAQINFNGDEIDCNVSITFEWLPSRSIMFKTSLDEPNGNKYINFDRASKITIPKAVDTVPISITNLMISGANTTIRGHSEKAVIFSEHSEMKYVIFHLVNFTNLLDRPIRKDSQTWKGRSVMEFDGWKLTIDSVKDLKKIKDLLDTELGFAITHVARLERIDNSSFSEEQAKNILDGLYWFLSFARGIRSSPILPVGFDTEDKCVWREWQALIVMPWNNTNGWLSDRNFVSNSLEEALIGFWKKWNNPIWNDPETNNLPLRTAIHWLTSCNVMDGGIEGSIILAQTGLELICWVLLVEDTKDQNKESFDKLSASKKIEALFAQIGIDTAIPKKLEQLINLSSIKGWQNGSEAITGYRNTIVHPKRRAKNADVVIDASWEILELSLWYLELSLLYLFDYQGYYVNRINAEWAGQVEKVPWCRKTTTSSQ